MAVIDIWSLYRNTISKDHLIKCSLCTGFLNTVKSDVKIALSESNLSVRRSCKQLNVVSRSGKALHEVSKICEQLYEVRGTCKQLL